MACVASLGWSVALLCAGAGAAELVSLLSARGPSWLCWTVCAVLSDEGFRGAGLNQNSPIMRLLSLR